MTIQCQIETKKVYYLDTSYVKNYINAYYIGCTVKKFDTVYYLNSDLVKFNNWEIYYDKKFKNKFIEYLNSGDTLTTAHYFKNGQKKNEDVTLGYHWLTSKEWCENGQIVQSTKGSVAIYQSVTHYYCNGKKKWQANVWAGTLWGTETRWYENGQKKYEKRYIEYKPAFDSIDGAFNNKPIGPNKYWDENGNELTEEPNDRIQNINVLGYPMHVNTAPFEEKYPNIIPYDLIEDSPDYDNTMSLLQNKIYETTKKSENCKCTFGEVYIQFVIAADGTINNISSSSDIEKCYVNIFIDAVQKLGHWMPAKKNGKNIPVLVSMGLKIENLKK